MGKTDRGVLLAFILLIVIGSFYQVSAQITPQPALLQIFPDWTGKVIPTSLQCAEEFIITKGPKAPTWIAKDPTVSVGETDLLEGGIAGGAVPPIAECAPAPPGTIPPLCKDNGNVQPCRKPTDACPAVKIICKSIDEFENGSTAANFDGNKCTITLPTETVEALEQKMAECGKPVGPLCGTEIKQECIDKISTEGAQCVAPDLPAGMAFQFICHEGTHAKQHNTDPYMRLCAGEKEAGEKELTCLNDVIQHAGCNANPVPEDKKDLCQFYKSLRCSAKAHIAMQTCLCTGAPSDNPQSPKCAECTQKHVDTFKQCHTDEGIPYIAPTPDDLESLKKSYCTEWPTKKYYDKCGKPSPWGPPAGGQGCAPQSKKACVGPICQCIKP